MAQFNSLLVTGNSRFLNPINGNARNGIYYVKGTQTAATGSWTGNIPVPALYDGLTISYYLPYGGSGNATLNLTLSDGTTTGAVNCYYQGNSRLTTHYGTGSNIMLTYHPAGAVSVNGTATTDNRWVAGQNYVDGNDQAYQVRDYYNSFKAGSNKVFPYTIIMQNADGRWESIVTSASASRGKARNSHGFRLGQIALMYANATYNENVVLAYAVVYNAYTSGLVDHRCSFNTENNSTYGTVANKPVYLVGSINASDGLFYLDSTTWWTQTLPSTADGKIYIYLGDAYDYYRMSFPIHHPAYVYTNGHVREYAQDASTVGGHTVAKDVPSNAVFTDTKNTAGSTNNTGKLFLVGALEQSANPQTYSNSNCYIDSSTVYSKKFIARVNNVNLCEVGYNSNAGTLVVNDSTGKLSAWMSGSSGMICGKDFAVLENVSGTLKNRVRHVIDTTDHFGKTTWYQGDNVKRVVIQGSNYYEETIPYEGENKNISLFDGEGTETIYMNSTTGKIYCHSIEFAYVSGTSRFVKSSGSWTFKECHWQSFGNVVTVNIQFKGGSSNVSVGSNAIVGTITDIPKPPFTVRLEGYYSGTVLMGELTTSGGFNVRILGQALNLSSSNTAVMSGTYVVED